MATMNVKRFKSVLGDLVKASVQNGSPYANQIIKCVTKRLTELSESKGTDTLRVEDEIVNIINAIQDHSDKKIAN